MTVKPNKPTTPADAGLQHHNSAPAKVIGKPFPPGVSGNPSGRRRGSVSLKATLKSRLTKTEANAICDKLISQARAGNHQAQRLILENCGDEMPLHVSVGFAATAPQVILTLPAGRAEGIMPCMVVSPETAKPAPVTPPQG